MTGRPHADPAGARERAIDALRRAIYLLDRGLAPSQKVRAFANAMDVIDGLGAQDLISRVQDGSLTQLAGIGASTGSVISAAVTEEDPTYLERLDADTACPPRTGAALRELLRGDLHCHSTWSDGGATIREMVDTAIALGHDHLAITDHSPRLTVAHGLSVQRLADQLVEIDRIRPEVAPFRILTGMEVDILADGSLDLPDQALEQLDVVVASVHSKLRMDPKDMTERMVRAVVSPHVDILGHCTGRKIVGTGRPPSQFDAEVVFAACARFGTAVEINCRPERRDPPPELLELATEWDCLFAIDTDAHAPGQMEWQNWGCDLATDHSIGSERIINTWSAEDLLAWAGSHPII
ncbi:MAG: PHP domain-containing protein [Microthrixaceae bacterium]